MRTKGTFDVIDPAACSYYTRELGSFSLDTETATQTWSYFISASYRTLVLKLITSRVTNDAE